MDFIWNSTIEAVGDEILEALVVKNKLTGETSNLEVNGCFVFVGYDPISTLFEGQIDMEHGYILTDEDMA